ncbi:hypothetical protein BGZ58_001371 [Dissophora ornata]|nr:hypothetical protein BGZ58_001371 [Dissophora ornata]
MPKFRPEMDDSHPGSSEKYTPMKTTSTSTSGSGYGMLRNRDDDDDDMDGLGSSEPPKKRQRSMSLMLLDAAVETVIFTGAVALSAYQLLTGKSKLGSHSKQSSMTSEDADAIVREGNAKTLDEDPMEEKLSWQSTTATTTAPRTLGRPRVGGNYKAKTRSYRPRQSYASAGTHTRLPPMPVRPNTGTEDTDEAFLRMEAQLTSLIAEGKRALNSRVEVWDEE